MKYIVFSLFILIAYCSCVNNTTFEQNNAIKDQDWTYDQRPSFNVPISDSSAKYNIYINLRHTNTYAYANLSVLLNEKGNKLTDTAYISDINLAEADGRWLGKSSGSLYEVEYLAKENYSFPDTGVYIFSIEQNMRVNPLKDIVDVGIKVVKQ